MEFKKLKSFLIKNEIQKKKNFKKYDNIKKIICFDYNKKYDVAVAGLNNGNLNIWSKKSEIINIKLYSEEVIFYTLESKENDKHKGQISIIKGVEIQNNLYFISGSFDRNIKIWKFHYNKSPEIVQTINNHQGGILDIEFYEKESILISISNDGYLKIFSLDKAKKYFINPLFIQICNFSFKNDIYPFLINNIKNLNKKKYIKENTIFNKIKYFKKNLENLFVIIGDSIGNIHILELNKNKLNYIKSNISVHRLGIKDICINIKDNIMLTTSYDQYINCFDISTGKEYFKIKEDKLLNYIKLGWLPKYKELYYIENDNNAIYIKNMKKEKNDFQIKLNIKEKIISFNIIDNDLILIYTINEVIFYDIQRKLKQQNLISNLKKSITQMIYLDLNIIYGKNFLNEILITLNQDGEIDIWDLLDQSKILNLDCSNKSEAYHINFIESIGLLLSGHINGSLYLWDIELGNYIKFIYPNNINEINSITCSKHFKYIIKDDKNEVFDILLTSGFDGKIYLWEWNRKKKNGNEIMIFPQMKYHFFPNLNKIYEKIGNEIFSIEYSDIKEYIFFAGNNKKIFVYKINKNLNTNFISNLEGHTNSINNLKLDKNILFSIGDDGLLIAWDINKLYILNCIELHKYPINNFKFIKNTSFFITTNIEGEIIIYNYKIWKTVKKINKYKKILSLEFNQKENKWYLGFENLGIIVIDIKEFNLINNNQD